MAWKPTRVAKLSDRFLTAENKQTQCAGLSEFMEDAEVAGLLFSDWFVDKCKEKDGRLLSGLTLMAAGVKRRLQSFRVGRAVADRLSPTSQR